MYYSPHNAIVIWQKDVRWLLFWLMGLVGWLVLVQSARFGDQIHQDNQLSNRQKNPGNSSWVYFIRIVRNSPTFTVRAATAKLSNLLYSYNQKWNSSKPSFGHQKGECEADKNQQLTQESSLITGGFSWASDVERSELQSYYEMISHNVKWFPDLLKKNVLESAKRIFRCQYFCLVHLGV